MAEGTFHFPKRQRFSVACVDSHPSPELKPLATTQNSGIVLATRGDLHTLCGQRGRCNQQPAAMRTVSLVPLGKHGDGWTMSDAPVCTSAAMRPRAPRACYRSSSGIPAAISRAFSTPSSGSKLGRASAPGSPEALVERPQ